MLNNFNFNLNLNSAKAYIGLKKSELQEKIANTNDKNSSEFLKALAFQPSGTELSIFDYIDINHNGEIDQNDIDILALADGNKDNITNDDFSAMVEASTMKTEDAVKLVPETGLTLDDIKAKLDDPNISFSSRLFYLSLLGGSSDINNENTKNFFNAIAGDDGEINQNDLETLSNLDQNKNNISANDFLSLSASIKAPLASNTTTNVTNSAPVSTASGAANSASGAGGAEINPAKDSDDITVLESELKQADSDLIQAQTTLETQTSNLGTAQKNVADIQEQIVNNDKVKDLIKNNPEIKNIDTQIENNLTSQTAQENQIQGFDTSIAQAQSAIDSADATITSLNNDITQYEYNATFAMKTVEEKQADGTVKTVQTPDEDAKAAARESLRTAREQLKEAEESRNKAQNDKLDAEKAKADAQKELANLKVTRNDLLQNKTDILSQITEELAKNDQEINDLRTKLVDAQNNANEITKNINDAKTTVDNAVSQKSSIMEKINAIHNRSKNVDIKKVIAGVYGNDKLDKDGVLGDSDWSNPDDSEVTEIERDGRTIYKIGDIEIDPDKLQEQADSLANTLGSGAHTMSVASLIKLDLADGKADGNISSNVNDYQDSSTSTWIAANPNLNNANGLTKQFFEKTVDDDQSGNICITNRTTGNQAIVSISSNQLTFGMGDSQDNSVGRTIQNQNGWMAGGLAMYSNGNPMYDAEFHKLDENGNRI